jgi:hypothetical protein
MLISFPDTVKSMIELWMTTESALYILPLFTVVEGNYRL